MWTRFMDMHSGGGSKEEWEYIYIEAPEEEAKVIFYNKFGHNPDRVTCTCCGGDYSIDESETLEEATAYDRGCEWDSEQEKYVDKPHTGRMMIRKEYITLPDYCKRDDVLVISDCDISVEHRKGDVPDEGYVWV